MQKNSDRVNDAWYHTVKKILQIHLYPPSFIGHCCEVQNKIEARQIRRIKDNITPQYKLRYDGYLHLPQLYILLSSPSDNYVDIYGFGSEDKAEQPRLTHGVINKTCAEECHKSGVVPDGRLCTKLLNQIKDITFESMYEEEVQKNYIQTFLVNTHMNTRQYKHRYVTPWDIDQS